MAPPFLAARTIDGHGSRWGKPRIKSAGFDQDLLGCFVSAVGTGTGLWVLGAVITNR
jgi:hypothetical protein